MHKILQADTPDDFVLATGETRSVREFVEIAFAEIGRSIEWRGKGVEETGIDSKIRQDRWSASIRCISAPPKSIELIGDASKARQKLGWKPKTTFAAARQGDGGGRSRDRPAGGRQWQELRLS